MPAYRLKGERDFFISFFFLVFFVSLVGFFFWFFQGRGLKNALLLNKLRAEKRRVK